MKRYKITVDGVVYQVEVEELGAASSVPAHGPVAATGIPAVRRPEEQAAANAKAGAAVHQPAAANASGGVQIKAPMPGTVLSVNVTAGQQVKAGDILLILEAMKMENEIVAPADGKVLSVTAVKGTSVNAGDVLVTL